MSDHRNRDDILLEIDGASSPEESAALKRRRAGILRGFKPRPEPSLSDRFLDLFRMNSVRLAAVLGLVALVAVPLAILRRPPRIETLDVMGTLAPRTETVIDARRLELDGVRGLLETRIAGGRVLVEVRLDADHPVRLDVLASPAAWTMAPELAPEDILQRVDRWTIQHEGSRVHRFTLKPGAAEAPFRLRITSGEAVSVTDLGSVRALSAR